jgi:hypothetical protein
MRSLLISVCVLAGLLLNGCGQSGGTSETASAEQAANIPQAYRGLTGTYHDPANEEWLRFVPSPQAPAPGYQVLYRSHRRSFFAITVADYGLEDGNTPYFTVTFRGDPKRYKLVVMKGEPPTLKCYVPGGDVQYFQQVSTSVAETN